MTKRIAVVGVGGVGMAHVVAAVRGGNDVCAIIDKDQEILSASTSRWANIWGGIVEEVIPQKDCIYSTTTNILKTISDLDTIILATPPDSHEILIKECIEIPCKRIIVEKPLSMEKVSIFNDKLFVSSEWIYHSEINWSENFNILGMAYLYESKPKRWGYRLSTYFDLMPHLLSILNERYWSIGDLRLRYENQDSFLATIMADGNMVTLYGHRKSDEGLIINNKRYHWEMDLFDKQINSDRLTNWWNLSELHNLMIDSIK